MEVVIRTAHGGADVDIESFDEHSTLRDLLTGVTGLSVPTVVDIDGRPCRVEDRIADAIATVGLRVGSVIDVTTDRPLLDQAPPPGARSDLPDASRPLVLLRQLSGRGAGEVVPLPAGRFRFGAGRRLVERELGMAVVEEEAFTVTVTAPSPDAAPMTMPSDRSFRPTVTVRPGANVAGELGSFTPMLGGELFDRELTWTDERLSVGGRVFELVDAPSDDDDEVDPTAAIGAARIGRPDRDGVRSFDAAGTIAVLGDGDQAPSEPTISALARLADPTRTLWRRRPHDDRFAVPIGLTADHRDVASVDLDRHNGVAISGSSEFTIGLARTVLVELATLLGPGDLDVVVIASAGRLGRWDWAKWLPHVRGGDPTGPPRFLTTDDDVAAWRDSLAEGSVGEAPGGHLQPRVGWAPPDQDGEPGRGAPLGTGALPPPTGRPHARPTVELLRRRTLVVVDDAAHWMRRDSPLRTMLVDPHANVRILATTERVADAPGSCTALVDELRPADILEAGRPDGAAGTTAATRLFGSLCRLVERLGANPIVTTDVRPALTQQVTATHVALELASYDDLRVRRGDDSQPAATRTDRPTLGDLLGLSSSGAERSQTLATSEDDEVQQPGGRTEVAVGRLTDDRTTRAPHLPPFRSTDAATIDIAHAGVTAIAVDEPDNRQLLGAIVLGVAARNEPDDVAILLVAEEEPRWLAPLPHVIGTVDGDDTEQVGRVLRRVASALSADPEFELLVVIDRGVTEDGPARLRDATIAFAELAASLERVHLVVSAATEHADMMRRHLGTSAGAFLEAHADGTATLARRTDGIEIGTARIMPTVEILLPVAQTPPPPAPSAGLRVRPFVYGRPLTPIERRLSRRNDPLRHAGGQPGDAVHAVAVDDERIGGLEPAHDHADRLLPPPFPDRVGQETLLNTEDRLTDGMISLGIIDRADDPGLDVLRWTPQAGTIIGLGHRRSGMGTLVELVAAGLTDLDADVWVLDPLPQRRRAFRRLPRCRKTAEPDSIVSVERFLDDVEEHVAEVRRRQADSGSTTTPDHLADVVRGGPRPTVVVIADVNRTLALFDDDGAAVVLDRLRRLAAASDQRGGIGGPTVALVVSGSRRAEVEPLLDLAADVLIGELDDQDRRAFGVPDRPLRGGPRDGVPGRCWSLTRQRLVQLATPPDRLEQYVRDRAGALTRTETGASEQFPPPVVSASGDR